MTKRKTPLPFNGASAPKGTSSVPGMSRRKLEDLVETQALKIAELEGKLEESKLDAAHDWTGLLNKEHFLTASAVLLKHSHVHHDDAYELPDRRKKTTKAKSRVAVIMMDGASFKKINDTYGHAAGDEVIMYLSKTIADNFRDTDVTGHFGGDEFAVTVHNATEDMIHRKMRAINAHMSLTFKDGTVIKPFIDYGIYFPVSGDNIESSIKSADEDLYVRKNARKEAEQREAAKNKLEPNLS